MVNRHITYRSGSFVRSYSCLAQKPDYGPNYNPYSYCLNNPLKYIDPSGFNYDWYQNVLTGDMYYNSTYKGESDAEKIDGEGWEYFGPDGMFGKSEWDLAREYNLPSKTPPLANGLGFNVEISLKGDKAEGFMQEMGYEFKPTLQAVLNIEISNPSIPTGSKGHVTLTTGEIHIKNYTGAYFPEHFVETERNEKWADYKKPLYNIFFDQKTESSKTLCQINYGEKSWKYYLQKSFEFMQAMNGNHNYQRIYIYNRWDYPKKNNINEIRIPDLPKKR